MKRIVLSIAAAALALFGAAPAASAHSYSASRYVSSHARCGCPVYVQRYIAWYDAWGRPVWRTRVLPVVHRCGWGRSYPAPRYPMHGGHSHHSRHRGWR